MQEPETSDNESGMMSDYGEEDEIHDWENTWENIATLGSNINISNSNSNSNNRSNTSSAHVTQTPQSEGIVREIIDAITMIPMGSTNPEHNASTMVKQLFRSYRGTITVESAVKILKFIPVGSEMLAAFHSLWSKVSDKYNWCNLITKLEFDRDVHAMSMIGACMERIGTDHNDYGEQIFNMQRVISTLADNKNKLDAFNSYFGAFEVYFMCDQLLGMWSECKFDDAAKVGSLKTVYSKLLDVDSERNKTLLMSKIESSTWKGNAKRIFDRQWSMSSISDDPPSYSSIPRWNPTLPQTGPLVSSAVFSFGNTSGHNSNTPLNEIRRIFQFIGNDGTSDDSSEGDYDVQTVRYENKRKRSRKENGKDSKKEYSKEKLDKASKLLLAKMITKESVEKEDKLYPLEEVEVKPEVKKGGNKKEKKGKKEKKEKKKETEDKTENKTENKKEEAEKKETKKETDCVVCLERDVAAMIVDCSHIIMCQRCTWNIMNLKDKNARKCPVCRTEITCAIQTH